MTEDDRNSIHTTHLFYIIINFILYSEQIVGDVYVKASSYLDALVYSNAGADVYLYFYDTDGLGDTIAGIQSCCGLGHAKDS